MKYDSIIILGPTASGKTGLSVKLAQKLNGEIINADSQQIYKNLNIGTAKATKEEQENIPHHLFDIIQIGESFSVSEYRKLAIECIKEVKSKGKIPIIVGGTGFYIDSLLYKLDFGNSEADLELRKKYEILAKEKGNKYIHEILVQLDPASAKILHPNDLKRVIRAIEIATKGGIKKSEQTKAPANLINPLIIGVNCDRNELYSRINSRVDKMLDDGLFDEIITLFNKGIYNLKISLPIGYSEWKEYFEGTHTKEEVIEKIKQDTRNYAKRQITWFKRLNCTWFDLTKSSINEIIYKLINTFCE